MTTHQANKHTPPYCTLNIHSYCRGPLHCPPLPTPITARRHPLTYCSLPTPPTIHPLCTASPVCWWGGEGAIGQRAMPPSDKDWQGRATKSAVAAATGYHMLLYHLFVCLFFAPLIDSSTIQPVPTSFAGNVGCWHAETRVKKTDMCLLGQHVTNMSADMSALHYPCWWSKR